MLILQGGLENERQKHDSLISAMREEERLKIDKVARDLELKWTETLRYCWKYIVYDKSRKTWIVVFSVCIPFFF